MELLSKWLIKLFGFLFGPSGDTSLAEGLTKLTDQDYLIWEKRSSDIGGCDIEYKCEDKEDREFVVAQGANESAIIFIGVGNILSRLSKVKGRTAKELLRSIKKQQERIAFDDEFNQLIRDYK